MIGAFDWQITATLAKRVVRTQGEKMKDYLGYENERNKKWAALYTAIIRKAFGSDTQVLIGHHLCTEHGNDLNTENEIPSADTLIFDHEIMDKVFGKAAHTIMRSLATIPTDRRDSMLQLIWNDCFPNERLA